MTRIVEVVPYNPAWPTMFEEEAHLIKQCLGDNCIAIHHIGSTSIPGLSAKPIIDIIPVVSDIVKVDNVTSEFEKLGYKALGENGMLFRRFFQKGSAAIKTHNVHVFEKDNPEVMRHINFRDWMRTHPDDLEAYSTLKLSLAAKFPDDILKYVMGKDEFVASIDKKAGFDSPRIVKALTDREWKAVRMFRKTYSSNSNTTIIHAQDHLHFVLYYGTEIAGYMYLELLPDQCVKMHMLIIHEPYQQLDLDHYLMKQIRRWLSEQGIHQFI